MWSYTSLGATVTLDVDLRLHIASKGNSTVSSEINYYRIAPALTHPTGTRPLYLNTPKISYLSPGTSKLHFISTLCSAGSNFSHRWFKVNNMPMFSNSSPEAGNQTLTIKTFNTPNTLSHRNYNFNCRLSECETCSSNFMNEKVDSIWEKSAGQHIET